MHPCEHFGESVYIIFVTSEMAFTSIYPSKIIYSHLYTSKLQFLSKYLFPKLGSCAIIGKVGLISEKIIFQEGDSVMYNSVYVRRAFDFSSVYMCLEILQRYIILRNCGRSSHPDIYIFFPDLMIWLCEGKKKKTWHNLYYFSAMIMQEITSS